VAVDLLNGVLLLSAGIPIWLSWQANRSSALAHTVVWAAAAWATWTASAWAEVLGLYAAILRYLALSLTGCAIVAVLGARRPGVGAWNFVVAGLLAVTLLPIAQNYVAGAALGVDALPIVLIGGVMAVGMINYLPTRLGTAAVVLGAACAVQLWNLGCAEPGEQRWQRLATFLVALVPWVALWSMRRPRWSESTFDQTWLDFRDRFGLVWGQRLREQFNRAAGNAGWPVVLTWRGLREKRGQPGVQPGADAKILETLLSLMKRFGPRLPRDTPAV
jgi:hypothetical protein